MWGGDDLNRRNLILTRQFIQSLTLHLRQNDLSCWSVMGIPEFCSKVPAENVSLSLRLTTMEKSQP